MTWLYMGRKFFAPRQTKAEWKSMKYREKENRIRTMTFISIYN